MMEEGLSHMDAFVAVTGRSETNILAAMQAKRLGVKKVIAEVENLNYISMAESVGIDHHNKQEACHGVEHIPFHYVDRRAGHTLPDGKRGRRFWSSSSSPTRPPRSIR